MGTVVVSGRVDEQVKREVDRILEREGTTAAEVIKQMWVTISVTGEVPRTEEQERRFREQRERFKRFVDFTRELPPASEWLINLTDEEMRDMIASRYV